MQHLRGRIAKSDVRTTYVPRTTYVRTYHVPTHPALCLGTSVPRQKKLCGGECWTWGGVLRSWDVCGVCMGHVEGCWGSVWSLWCAWSACAWLWDVWRGLWMCGVGNMWSVRCVWRWVWDMCGEGVWYGTYTFLLPSPILFHFSPPPPPLLSSLLPFHFSPPPPPLLSSLLPFFLFPSSN